MHREGVSEPEQDLQDFQDFQDFANVCFCLPYRFYSLPPGRRFRTLINKAEFDKLKAFLFPSPGTAFPKEIPHSTMGSPTITFPWPSGISGIVNLTLMPRSMLLICAQRLEVPIPFLNLNLP